MNTPKSSIITIQLKNELSYGNAVILQYHIFFPEFKSTQNKAFFYKLNSYYLTKSHYYKDYIESDLYKNAIKEYEFAQSTKTNMIPYHITASYKITYYFQGAISLCIDYTEEKQKNEKILHRVSDTWDIPNGKSIEMKDFFYNNKNYLENIQKEIEEQILYQIEHKGGTLSNFYFPDWKNRINQYFDTDNFFLTLEGISIYFQPNELGSEELGIPTFFIPFNNYIKGNNQK